MSELKKGMFVVTNSTYLRNALLRVMVFAYSASILWSLLSLVATEKLQFQERGFGLCLGLIGVGAVGGAGVLSFFRRRFTSETILMAAQLIFGALCLAIGISSNRGVILPALVVIGFCWMTSMTTLNATAQVNLPRKFRARGMSAFLMSFAMGMSLGSLSWGWLAYALDLSWAFVAAALAMALSTLAMVRLKIGPLAAE